MFVLSRNGFALKLAPFEGDATFDHVLPKIVNERAFNTSFYKSSGSTFCGLDQKMGFDFGPNKNPLYLMASVGKKLMYYIFHKDSNPSNDEVSVKKYVIAGVDQTITDWGIEGGVFEVSTAGVEEPLSIPIPLTQDKENTSCPFIGAHTEIISRLEPNEFLALSNNKSSYPNQKVELISPDQNFKINLTNDGFNLIRDRKGVNDNEGNSYAGEIISEITLDNSNHDLLIGVFDGVTTPFTNINGIPEDLTSNQILGVYKVINDQTLELDKAIITEQTSNLFSWGFDKGGNLTLNVAKSNGLLNNTFKHNIYLNKYFDEYFPKEGTGKSYFTIGQSLAGVYDSDFNPMRPDQTNFSYLQSDNGTHILKYIGCEPFIFSRTTYNENNTYNFQADGGGEIYGTGIFGGIDCKLDEVPEGTKYYSFSLENIAYRHITLRNTHRNGSNANIGKAIIRENYDNISTF